MAQPPALVFDLDGTLVDSVYQHVLAWHEALQSVGIDLSIWRIHRKVGMSGGLMTQALLREIDHPLEEALIGQLRRLHAEAYTRHTAQVRPLRGARELLAYLSQLGVRWAIATSGGKAHASITVKLLGVPDDAPVVFRDEVPHAKPDPDLFLRALEKLGATVDQAMVVGDSVWDLLAARRARMLGVGVLSGGYGREELLEAGAYRVYEDPQDLLEHLNEVGIRTPPP